MKSISEALEAYSFHLYSLSGEYAEKTLEITYGNSVTVYDASYVALAIIRGTVVYTADEKLVHKLRREYRRYVRSLRDLR